MDGNKLELTGKPTPDVPTSYKAIPEADMEEEAVTRPKSLVKSKPATPEVDGADEKMLPKEEEVKVSPNEKQNGDAKLDIGELKTAFVGLTKEELMKYANDPFWVRLRWFLFITFWILWGLMLLGAILIILAAPKCNPPPPRTWWEKGPIAEVDQDSDNSDSIVQKLKDLSVTGVIVSWPDDAYIDFDETHDFIKSLKKYKDEDINVIMEVEAGYSHVWFNKSEYKDPEFSNYYIWQPPKDMSNGEGPHPPNNWVSMNNNSSWKFSDKRNEYYYAPTGQPHLNFRNPNVTDRFSDIINKFLRYGVGGIRLRGASNLLVDEKFTDEVNVQNPGDCVLNDYCFYIHSHTENLNDLGPLLKKWRDVVKNKTDNGPFMISEDLNANIEAYKLNSSYIVDLPLQSHFVFKPNINVANMLHIVNTTFTANNFTWPLWKANSSSEWDIVTYLLPGTPLIAPSSLANKDLLKIRDSPSIMRGSFNMYSINEDTVFAFSRVMAGNPGILVAFNPSENRTVVNFPAYVQEIPHDGEVTVLLFTKSYNETDISVNVKYDAKSIPISSKSAIVLSYVPKTE
ncbi:amino acid transporter heavy chain SLC3A1 [Zophobas morio]|uniref:amino acid transporter heavy chain SLC3A1 n=1 Tax=Zophobas morio TaxID=2755281 RepID=UPI003083734A